MYNIGCDVGITGAVALLPPPESSFKEIAALDLPVYQDGKHQMINAVALASILRGWLDQIPHKDLMVYVERVSAMPGQGVSGMFNFGTSYGIILGVIGALGMPMGLVTPGAWKKRAGLLHKDKDEARTLAQRLYPMLDLSRKKDIGRADAILIARFGKEEV